MNYTNSLTIQEIEYCLQKIFCIQPSTNQEYSNKDFELVLTKQLLAICKTNILNYNS